MKFLLSVLAVSVSTAFADYQYNAPPYYAYANNQPYAAQVQPSQPGVLRRLLSIPSSLFGGIWQLLYILFDKIPLSIAYVYNSIMTFFGFLQGKPTYMNFYQGTPGWPTYSFFG